MADKKNKNQNKMSSTKNRAGCLNLEHIGLPTVKAGWKYYNTIRKKAVEQEFSWSGLFISLSIAFFIVVSCASILRFAYSMSQIRQATDPRTIIEIHRLERNVCYLS
jgi:hypothetical protein